jgi:asparagine synthase (glutamine-hydrolysing)
MLALDITRRSLPRLLRFEDRNSMAFSLESRVPFADDPRLIELVYSLPDSARIWRGWSKYVLRQAMAGVVPDKVRWRKRKLGFSVPERRWAEELQTSGAWAQMADWPSRYSRPAASEQRPRDEWAAARPSLHMAWRLLELGVWETALRDRTLGTLPAQNELVVAVR